MQQRFLLQILLLAQHISVHHYAHHQELKSIRQWLLPVVFHFKCMQLSTTSTVIKSHPTNGIPDPQAKLHTTKKPTKNTHTQPPRHSTRLVTNLDNTRRLRLRTQIPQKLTKLFFTFLQHEIPQAATTV